MIVDLLRLLVRRVQCSGRAKALAKDQSSGSDDFKNAKSEAFPNPLSVLESHRQFTLNTIRQFTLPKLPPASSIPETKGHFLPVVGMGILRPRGGSVSL